MWRMSSEQEQKGDSSEAYLTDINAYPVLVLARCDWTAAMAPGTGACISSALANTIEPISPFAYRPKTVETYCIYESDDDHPHHDPLQP